MLGTPVTVTLDTAAAVTVVGVFAAMVAVEAGVPPVGWGSSRH